MGTEYFAFAREMNNDFDRIPLPDFDDLVISSPVVSYERSITGNCESMLRSMGFEIDSSGPLRCTNNSAVFAARSADGTLSAVKVTSFIKTMAGEYQKRKMIPDSPYLVESLNFLEEGGHGVLQMELCSGDIRNRDFTEQELWMMIHDIGSALAVIHESGWIHLDVSPGNILMTEGVVFKLSDFGTIVRFGEFDCGCEGAGPFVSPESLEFPCRAHDVGAPSDIFSFGVVLLEAASGKAAPRGGNDAYVELRKGRISLGDAMYPCHCSSELIEIVNMMIDRDPSKRPTASQLANLIWAKLSVMNRCDTEYETC